ncbi:hypothetical protein NC651_026522 [Populus alba x Populus x berolinensis]|nr:hypothetical protein NC651_026522 [Populus alba x Populus x berolinensis]
MAHSSFPKLEGYLDIQTLECWKSNHAKAVPLSLNLTLISSVLFDSKKTKAVENGTRESEGGRDGGTCDDERKGREETLHPTDGGGSLTEKFETSMCTVCGGDRPLALCSPIIIKSHPPPSLVNLFIELHLFHTACPNSINHVGGFTRLWGRMLNDRHINIKVV